jgi:hypothetical protein
MTGLEFPMQLRMFKFKLYCDRRSVGQSVLGHDQILIFFVWQLFSSFIILGALTHIPHEQVGLTQNQNQSQKSTSS